MKRIIALIVCVLLCIGIFPNPSVWAADAAPENVALGKPVTASSTMAGYDPNAIVDGDYNTEWARGNYAPNEYIMVDLGEQYRITSVVIHTRLAFDEVQYRANMVVEFSNTPDFAVKERIVATGEAGAPYGVPIEVPVTTKTTYRYVRVLKTVVNVHVFNELEVFGYIPDPNASNLGADVAGSFCEGAVMLVSQLEIMRNADEDVFGINHLLTRGEAADAAARMALGGASGFNDTALPFSDVAPDHKFYDGIAAAYSIGIISGDGNSMFRPNDYVTETELVYMVMRAIGYSEKVVGSSAALMNYSTRLDILENASVDDVSGHISRGNAAIVFYNALLAPTVEMSLSTGATEYYPDGPNTLYAKHGITLSKGVVLENGKTRLDGEAKKKEFDAEIDGTRFLDKKGMLDDYLGRRVIVATHKNSNEILLAWLNGDDKIVELKDSELLSTNADIESGAIVAENEKGKERRFNIEKNAPVVVNGYTDNYWKNETLMPEQGSLRLVDNDGDSAYDVVFAELYSLHYLNGGFSDDEQLTIINSKNERKTFKKEEVKVTDQNGATLSTKKVSAGVLIKLFETPTGEGTRIVVYSSANDGTVTATYGDVVEIDGVKHHLSVFMNNNRLKKEIEIGKTVKFFTEDDGELLWIDENSNVESDWVIAFSQTTGAEDVAFNRSVLMKVFDVNGAWHIYDIADKIRVDGVQKTKNEFAQILENAKNSNNWIYERSFVRYKLNSESKIREIDTLAPNEDSDFKKSGSIGMGLYVSGSGTFWSYHSQLAVAKNTTPVFVIPTVGGEYTTDTSFDDLYEVSKNITNITGERNYKEQNIDFYMPDEYGMPAFLAKKQAYASAGEGIVAVNDDNAPNIIVQTVEEQIIDSETVYKVSGRNLSTLADESFYADETLNIIEAGVLYQEKFGTECFGDRGVIQVAALSGLSEAEREKYISNISEIGFGDIIRYETLSSKARAVERVFDYEPDGLPDVTIGESAPSVWFAANGTYPEFYLAFNRYQFGTVSEVTEKTFTLTSLSGEKEMYLKSTAPKMLYCKGGRSEILDYATDLFEFAEGNYKLVIFSYNTNLKSMVVYDFN